MTIFGFCIHSYTDWGEPQFIRLNGYRYMIQYKQCVNCHILRVRKTKLGI